MIVWVQWFFLNWRIIALQCCVGFCHTTMWISCKRTYVPPLLNLNSYLPDIFFFRSQNCVLKVFKCYPFRKLLSNPPVPAAPAAPLTRMQTSLWHVSTMCCTSSGSFVSLLSPVGLLTKLKSESVSIRGCCVKKSLKWVDLTAGLFFF